MKTIYKSLMTIAFAGLSLASCDKELKEETAMEVGVVTDSNVSFDGILVHRTGAVCGRDEAVYSALGKAKHEGNIRLSDDKDDRHRNPVRILDTIASASSCQGAHQRRGTV